MIYRTAGDKAIAARIAGLVSSSESSWDAKVDLSVAKRLFTAFPCTPLRLDASCSLITRKTGPRMCFHSA